MTLQVLWLCLVTSVVSRVVHQPDGIISIITELEPDKTPISYLQATVKTPSRGALVVHHTEPPPLEEGQFRVSSDTIQVGNTQSDLKNTSQAHLEDKKKDKRAPSTGNKRESEITSEPASNRNVVQPVLNSRTGDYDKNSRLREQSYDREVLRGKSKPGKYGYQTPRGNDRPTKFYTETEARPIGPRDDFVTSNRKSGKPGRYGKYVTYPPLLEPSHRTRVNTKNKNIRDFEREGSSSNNPRQRKSEKEYSSTTVVEHPDGYVKKINRKVESSSKHKSGSSESNKYQNQSGTDLKTFDNSKELKDNYPTSIKDRIESDENLEGASSFIDSRSVESLEDVYSDGHLRRGKYIGNIGSGYKGGYGTGYGKERHFEKHGGNNYLATHTSSLGGKNEKGHSNDESFSKGENKKHGKEDSKGYNAEREDNVKSHLDKTSQYSSGHKASEGVKGSDIQRQKGHRRGHKTSGFKSVVHKDEFQKKEEFYDEDHDSGEEKQRGHSSEQHAEKAGGEEEKQYLDSGHHDAHRGHEGGHGTGHGYSHHQGYHRDHGHSGHHGHEEDYGKKSGHKLDEVRGSSGFGRYY